MLAVGVYYFICMSDRCKFGIGLIAGETLLIFRQKSNPSFMLKVDWKGQLGHLCPALARCRTQTGSGSDSNVEFGSGPVKIC